LYVTAYLQAQGKLTDYVNPFLGTATSWDSTDIGYKPTFRTWGTEVFPESSVPNAIGLYTFSPAGPEYIISVPLFDKVEFKPGESVFTIIKARPQIHLLLQEPSSEM